MLSLHHPFDLVKGTVVDALHGVFLGVTSQLLSLWVDKKFRGETFYIGGKVITMYFVKSPFLMASYN